MTSRITVKPVFTKAETRQFLDLPFKIYGPGSSWVPPLYLERYEHLNPKKNPYFQHAEAQLFLAEKNGQTVGRISAQVDQIYLERYQNHTGHFGFLESSDDADVFDCLFEAASNWLRSRGMKQVQGPLSFSINDEVGLLIDGFDSTPNIMMPYAQPYYQTHIERAGFYKVKDVLAYTIGNKNNLPPAMTKSYERAIASSEIKVRPLSKKHLDRDLDIILDIHTDAWSRNWGFIPFTADELAALGKNLKMLVKEDYVAIATYRGEPAAMAVTLPNINLWLEGLGGKLMPLGWAKIIWHLFKGSPASIRMPLMGVRQKYHNSLIGSSLALSVIETLRRYHISNGTKTGELSWILEDNMAMRHLLERLGADVSKTYRIYEKSL